LKNKLSMGPKITEVKDSKMVTNREWRKDDDTASGGSSSSTTTPQHQLSLPAARREVTFPALKIEKSYDREKVNTKKRSCWSWTCAPATRGVTRMVEEIRAEPFQIAVHPDSTINQKGNVDVNVKSDLMDVKIVSEKMEHIMKGEQMEHHMTGETMNHHMSGDTMNHHMSGETMNHHMSGEQMEHHMTGETMNHHMSGEQMEHHMTGETMNHHMSGDTINHHMSGAPIVHSMHASAEVFKMHAQADTFQHQFSGGATHTAKLDAGKSGEMLVMFLHKALAVFMYAASLMTLCLLTFFLLMAQQYGSFAVYPFQVLAATTLVFALSPHIIVPMCYRAMEDISAQISSKMIGENEKDSRPNS